MPACDVDFVRETIVSFPTRSAPGGDGITPLFLKSCVGAVAPPITALINRVIRERVFPSSWKEAVVSVIPKCPGASHVNHFRPISLLSVVSKICERYILVLLRHHLNHTVSPAQFGFMHSRGTDDALFHVVSDVSEKLNKSCSVVLTSIDIRKAFDTIVHNKLFEILLGLGIPLPLFALIRSYMSGRSQRVRVGDCLSDASPLVSGVPQGSILGPFLFVIYFNQVFSAALSDLSSLFGFADNLLLASICSTVDHVRAINLDLTAVTTIITDDLYLSVNAAKTKSLVVGRSPVAVRKCPVGITVCGSPVVLVDCLRYLGVTFDSALSFSRHHSASCAGARRLMAVFTRYFRKFVSVPTRLCLYKALIRPRLLYGAIAIYPRLLTLRSLLERTQKRALRFILNNYDRDISYSQLLSDAGVRPLYSMIASQRLIRLHLYNIGSRHHLPSLFSRSPPTRYTRHYNPRQLAIPRCKFDIVSASPVIATARVYNSLGDKLDLSRSAFASVVNSDVFVDSILSSGSFSNFGSVVSI